MKTHTPGPWEILTTNRKTYVVTNALSQPFVGQVIAGPTTCPDWESNAHLIASAPELLSALEAVTKAYVELVQSDYPPSWSAEKHSEVISARKAIAKAKGNA
jgi:hypothetical protein